MPLQDLLNNSFSDKKIGMSEERFEAIRPRLAQYISFWKAYPDLFIDFLQKGENGQIPNDGLKFFFYQRVFLRVCLRYRYTYFVFPRAYSKSFLTVLSLIVKDGKSAAESFAPSDNKTTSDIKLFQFDTRKS